MHAVKHVHGKQLDLWPIIEFGEVYLHTSMPKLPDCLDGITQDVRFCCS